MTLVIVAQIYPGTKCEAYTFAIIKSQHAGCEEQSCTETLAMRTPLCFEPPLRGMIFLVEGMSSVAAKLFFREKRLCLYCTQHTLEGPCTWTDLTGDAYAVEACRSKSSEERYFSLF